MMEDEVAGKRQEITEGGFLDRLAAVNLIPRPTSTEVAIFIVEARLGVGLLGGGCCFFWNPDALTCLF
jgi:chromate transport protein ChrA